MLFKNFINTLNINRCCQHETELVNELDHINRLLDEFLSDYTNIDRLEAANTRLQALLDALKTEKDTHG